MDKKKIKESVKKGGAIYQGIQETFGDGEPWVMFDNSQSYTCYLLLSELTVEAVKKKLLSKQKEIDFYTKKAKEVAK